VILGLGIGEVRLDHKGSLAFRYPGNISRRLLDRLDSVPIDLLAAGTTGAGMIHVALAAGRTLQSPRPHRLIDTGPASDWLVSIRTSVVNLPFLGIAAGPC